MLLERHAIRSREPEHVCPQIGVVDEGCGEPLDAPAVVDDGRPQLHCLQEAIVRLLDAESQQQTQDASEQCMRQWCERRQLGVLPVDSGNHHRPSYIEQHVVGYSPQDPRIGQRDERRGPRKVSRPRKLVVIECGRPFNQWPDNRVSVYQRLGCIDRPRLVPLITLGSRRIIQDAGCSNAILENPRPRRPPFSLIDHTCCRVRVGDCARLLLGGRLGRLRGLGRRREQPREATPSSKDDCRTRRRGCRQEGGGGSGRE
mmetsp:Transcript_31548/g.78120  ORF Transcript_31548/g.78120 Transcript_31548/m.78120 type:complete len:258 (-) Transcript_31548:164-937(-)